MMNKLEYFNPNSPKQVKEFLLSEGIRLPDTSEATLEANKDRHPLIAEILKLRTLAKLKGTYIDGYRKHITAENLIHSEYSVEGTETGRCHSRNPNVQNVPKSARVFFTSRFEGGKLIQTDLSQLEYRLIAFATRDESLLQIFKDGIDLHTWTAGKAYQKPMDKINEQERKDAKTLNYGSIYGCGKEKFYNLLGREDEVLFHFAKSLYPRVALFKRRMEAQINHTGMVTNIFGRNRLFPTNADYSTYLEAFNWQFQSAGHLVTKLVGIELFGALEGTNCLLVNECHDSFIIDTPNVNVDLVKSAIDGININVLIERQFGVKLDVPMFLETEISENWK